MSDQSNKGSVFFRVLQKILNHLPKNVEWEKCEVLEGPDTVTVTFPAEMFTRNEMSLLKEHGGMFEPGRTANIVTYPDGTQEG